MSRKLTDENIQFIRDNPDMSLRELGEMFGVAKDTVRKHKCPVLSTATKVDSLSKLTQAILEILTPFGFAEKEFFSGYLALLDKYRSGNGRY